MGLGKTVEVLALVLSNPAPAGWVKNGDPAGTTCASPSEDLGLGVERPNAANRDDDGPAPSRIPRKYRSTATLVVCAVSLVGQWIDEARSKMDANNSLRIHMYHGTKRIKDPKKLAEDFDLVVTTYQTLASDRGKLTINHPTSQIEWFRIVLDEAHMAKSAVTAQSKVCFELRSARRQGRGVCLVARKCTLRMTDMHFAHVFSRRGFLYCLLAALRV
jgi:SNF2 family DNA or RNA helicase